MTKPHHDQGFTLTETLVALLVTSLAVAAILTATTLVGRHYKKATHDTHMTREIAALQADIYAQLHPLEPIEGDAVIGTPLNIRYKCQKAETCLIAPKRIRFKYISRGTSYATWPPKETIEGEDLPRLEALILQDEQTRTVGVINFVSEQGKDCVFDMISRNCRKTIEAETTRNGSSDGQ